MITAAATSPSYDWPTVVVILGALATIAFCVWVIFKN